MESKRGMSDQEIEQLVDRWIAYWDADPPDYEGAEADYLCDMLMPACECDPEVLWCFVRNAYKRNISERHLGLLAAGPLEDLIAYHGPEYIDRIEIEARQNPSFRHLLGGVWRNIADAEVWKRVETLRDKDIW